MVYIYYSIGSSLGSDALPRVRQCTRVIQKYKKSFNFFVSWLKVVPWALEHRCGISRYSVKDFNSSRGVLFSEFVKKLRISKYR